MSHSILDDLYYGNVCAWQRLATQSAERTALHEKIEAEKRYFITKMSPDDGRRFEALENLSLQAGEFEELDCFAYGLRFGALLMQEILMPERTLQQ